MTGKIELETALLRFITCGSVDDGKSTLIGRLLYEGKQIFDDQMETLADESRRLGTQGDDLDFALLVDGLAAEREQGITIDVAYRFFATARRKFIVADTPGHEQYTRNMVTAASNADLAILLVDARAGLSTQTRRHAYITSLLGVRRTVLAVNKLDLVDYSQDRFNEIVTEFAALAVTLGIPPATAIPMSALLGDNVFVQSPNTPWYDGPTLIEHLESVEAETVTDADGFFRMPVQRVLRPSASFRGFCGLVSHGTVSPGDTLVVMPSEKRVTVASVLTPNSSDVSAIAGQSITLTFNEEVSISRGDVLCGVEHAPAVADQFEASIVWMGDEPMLPGHSYEIRLGTQTVPGTLAEPKYKVNVNTQEHLASHNLVLNEIGTCVVTTARPLVFDPYTDSRDLGGFIVVDRHSKNTVGAGTVTFALRRATNLVWQDTSISPTDRSTLSHHPASVIWMTGLSGAGKSTIANALESRLSGQGLRTFMLDGDNVRHGLNKDLGFTDIDRIENLRRVAEVARLMCDAGLIVICSFISPFVDERQMAREIISPYPFLETYVDTSLEVAEGRDRKGLYAKARQGLIPNFTGIDSRYEAPESPELTVPTTDRSPEESAAMIIDYMTSANLLAT